jgi:hypothetical protein
MLLSEKDANICIATPQQHQIFLKKLMPTLLVMMYKKLFFIDNKENILKN